MEPAKPRLVISQRRADHKLCGTFYGEREKKGGRGEDGDSLNGFSRKILAVARDK